MHRCGGGCVHKPSEGVKPPAAWLRAEHRHSAHATRCTTTSVLRIGTRAGPSRRTHRSGTDGTVPPPGGGLSIPFPRAGIDPTSVDVTSAGRISTRMVLRRLAAVSRETGSQPPGSAHHACPFGAAVHVVTLGFAVLPQCTALDQHLPKQMYLPHSSISAQRLSSHRTRPTRRPTSSIHIAAASGSSSRAAAHDGSTSGKESPSVHQRHPAT